MDFSGPVTRTAKPDSTGPEIFIHRFPGIDIILLTGDNKAHAFASNPFRLITLLLSPGDEWLSTGFTATAVLCDDDDMKDYHLHLVSDATGETLETVVRAATAQFENVEAVEHSHISILTRKRMTMVLENIAENPGIVMFTIVSEDMRKQLIKGCRNLGVPCIPVLDPVLVSLANFLGEQSRGQPGRQHMLDAEYFSRIEALNFTMAHDDGQLPGEIGKADIILAGVSRTSKTPTSIYLAHRGYRVANIPIVPGCPLPPDLDGLEGPLIVGLTANPRRLVQIRESRLKTYHQEESAYIDPESVQTEVVAARRLFSRNHWPVIDVTRRSIEETAAAIIALSRQQQDKAAGSS